MKHVVLAFSVAVGFSFPHAARAQASDPELTDASKRVYEEAVAAANKADWALCRTKAIGVWQQIKSATVAGMLGICEAELGMNKEAAEHLDFFLLNQTKSPPAQVKQAKDRFEKVTRLVAIVTVVPTPSDAEVSVAGVTIGTGTQKVYVLPGDVTVAASKLGQSRSRSLTLTAGREERVEIEVPTTGEGGAGAGGVGGAGGGGAAAGGAGGGVPSGEPSPVWPAIVLGVAGGLGVVSGVGLTAGAAVTLADAESAVGCSPFTQACSTDAQTLLDDADHLQNAAFAMFAIGGAGFVGMAIYLAVQGTSSAPSVAFTPWIDGEHNGFILNGSF